MALLKSKTLVTSNGLNPTGNYWKIIKTEVDKQKLIVKYTIALFVSQAVADTIGSTPIGSQYVFSTSVTKSQLAGDIIALGYATIVAQVAAGVPSGFNPNSAPKQAYIDLASASNV